MPSASSDKKLLDSLVKELSFFPEIRIGNKKLGSLSIQFIPEKKSIKIIKRSYPILSLVLIDFSLALESILQLENKYCNSFQKRRTEKNKTISPYFRYSGLLNEGYRVPSKDIFDFIATEGPTSLRIPHVGIEVILGLMSEKHIKETINKLNKAMLKYVFKKSPEEIRFKEGRPRNIIWDIDKEFIPTLYQHVREILKKTKQDMKNNRGLDFKGMAIENIEKYYCPNKKRSNIKYVKLEKNIKGYVEKVFDSIFDNKEIGLITNTTKWEPNQIAKEALAESMMVSKSLVESYLYRHK